MRKKKSKFCCDLDGGILVISALRYSLGRMTYVISSTQNWIRNYWGDLDNHTKLLVVKEVIQFLKEKYSNTITSSPNVKITRVEWHDSVADCWLSFAAERYWHLGELEREDIDNCFSKSTCPKTKTFFELNIKPKINEMRLKEFETSN